MQEVAEQIGKSKRTVQRELEYAKQSLKGYDLTFHSKTGVGVWLEGKRRRKRAPETGNFPRQMAMMAETGKNAEKTDPGNSERKRTEKLFYYSSQFQVSEGDDPYRSGSGRKNGWSSLICMWGKSREAVW